jgi:CxxC motif-containing protein
MRALKPVEVTAPVTAGDVIVLNVCGTQANIIATRSMERIE